MQRLQQFREELLAGKFESLRHFFAEFASFLFKSYNREKQCNVSRPIAGVSERLSFFFVFSDRSDSPLPHPFVFTFTRPLRV